MPPRVMSISWVRNEADIIASFVRHHCALVHHMYIVDNGSYDKTWDILTGLRKEGYPLTLSQDRTPYHRQAEALTALLHAAATGANCSWVLPLDADEFLSSPPCPLPLFLQQCSPATPYALPWRTYVPTAVDCPSEQNVLRRILHRRAREPITFTKVLIPPGLAGDSTLRLAKGNHWLLRTIDGNDAPIPLRTLDSMFLAHFPVRSAAQLRRKIIEGWQRHCAHPRRQPGEMFHWELLAERCKDPSPITQGELRSIAMRYAVPPELYNTPNTVVYDPLSGPCSQRTLPSASSSSVLPATSRG